MKKNRLFILGIFTVMVALVSLSLVSGTWAKYTSTVSGQATATVAKWGWAYEGNNLDLTSNPQTIEFNLFQTRYDSDGSTPETDVKANLIAPGTSGKFDLEFANKSEVNAEYKVHFTVTNTSNVPLEYNVNGQGWKSTLDDITTAVQVAMETGTAKIEVEWRWAFESGADPADTTLGIDTPTVTVKAEITFEQVD